MATTAAPARALKGQVQQFNDRTSYANVVRMGRVSSTGLPSVKGVSIGNGWLHRSAVALLCDYRASEYLIDSFMLKGEGNATVRIRETSSRWSVNSVYSFGREAWLSCYGVLVHAWNSRTFTAIGQHWGEVIRIKDDTVNSSRFDIEKVKVFMNNSDVINHHMQLVVGFKTFTIRIAEEQAVFICNSDFRCQCACHTVDLNSGGRGSVSTDEVTDNGTDVGSLGARLDTGSAVRRSSGLSGGSNNIQEENRVDAWQMEELEQSVMARRAGHDDDMARDCIDDINNNECDASLTIRPYLVIGMGKGTGEKLKSSKESCLIKGCELMADIANGRKVGSRDLVIYDAEQMESGPHGFGRDGQVSVGLVDPSRNNICLPILESIGPDQQVDEIHLEVVLNMNIGREFIIPGGAIGEDGISAHSEDSGALPSSSKRVQSSHILADLMQEDQVIVRRGEGDVAGANPQADDGTDLRGAVAEEDLGVL
ncbi:hypothetical protein Dimus_003930 [Dionaea muscipula]